MKFLSRSRIPAACIACAFALAVLLLAAGCMLVKN